MDLRRVATVNDCYFGIGDDTKGRIIWYVAPPDAAWFEGTTVFRSLDWWDGLPPIQDRPGIVPYVKPQWSNGKTIAGYKGDTQCGEMAWWVNGIPSPPPPNPNRDVLGVPECCSGGIRSGKFACAGTGLEFWYRSENHVSWTYLTSSSVTSGGGLSSNSVLFQIGWSPGPVDSVDVWLCLGVFDKPSEVEWFAFAGLTIIATGVVDNLAWALLGVRAPLAEFGYIVEAFHGKLSHGIAQGWRANNVSEVFQPPLFSVSVGAGSLVEGASVPFIPPAWSGALFGVISNAGLPFVSSLPGLPAVPISVKNQAYLAMYTTVVRNHGPFQAETITNNPSALWGSVTIILSGVSAPISSVFTMVGSGQSLWPSSVLARGPFAMIGAGQVAWAASISLGGSFSMGGSGATAWLSGSLALSSFAFVGSGTANFAGAQKVAGTFGMVGTGGSAFVGHALSSAHFIMAGTGAAAWVGHSTAQLQFDVPGSVTIPSYITEINVACTGAGGTPKNTGNAAQTGAGGGAFASVTALGVTPGATYTVTVGAAPALGSLAGDGGISQFDTGVNVKADGGKGAGGGGAAGSSVGSVKFSGDAGQAAGAGVGGTAAGGNAAGSGGLHTGGAGAVYTGAVWTPAGAAGGGGGGQDTHNPGNSSKGADGRVVITW